MRHAEFFENHLGEVKCLLCPRACVIGEGRTGACLARRNTGGKLYAESYGRIASISMDPIEKKPLCRYFPGTKILSVGSYGCNMHCSFCQNYMISQRLLGISGSRYMPPEVLAKSALEAPQNLGVAFTYNEPLISFEYVKDTAPLIKEKGLKTVLVTNGLIMQEPLLEILPFIDAMNIDLKSFRQDFYRLYGGDIETVKNTIRTCAQSVHVEVTNLIIPEENDSKAEMDQLAAWIASVSPEIPLHINRFFPQYRMTGKQQTSCDTIFFLADVARVHLKYVYEGNVF